MVHELCNGWRNRETWNVALWIENDEGLYFLAVDYKDRCINRHCTPTYRCFIAWAHLIGKCTPDGYRYDSARLDYRALSDMIKEL